MEKACNLSEIDGLLFGTITRISKHQKLTIIIDPDQCLPPPYNGKPFVHFSPSSGTVNNAISTGQRVVYTLNRTIIHEPSAADMAVVGMTYDPACTFPYRHPECFHIRFKKIGESKEGDCFKKCSKLYPCSHHCTRICSQKCPGVCYVCLKLDYWKQNWSKIAKVPTPFKVPLKSQDPMEEFENIIISRSPWGERWSLEPRRKLQTKNPLDLNFRLVESCFLRHTQKAKEQYEILSVDYYVNPELVRKFRAKHSEFVELYGEGDRSATVLAFHGTEECNIQGIIDNNFLLELCKRSVYGKGIYLSEYPNVSLNFGRSLLLCKVLPGRSLDVTFNLHCTTISEGYNSHQVMVDHKGQGWALVIDNPDQILPCYVINYREIINQNFPAPPVPTPPSTRSWNCAVA